MTNPTVEKAIFAFLRIHDKVYQGTNGLIGHRFPGMPPNLLLHTTGAKTGQSRTNTLTYARDGGDYLIVASNGGANRYPGWYHNLKANPNVEINVGTKRFPVSATIVTQEDPDYDRLWKITNKNNRDMYNGYQKKTSRPINVVRLTP
jgi:deazaflavin-dependent oxidoreductase (nitroreductase family)